MNGPGPSPLAVPSAVRPLVPLEDVRVLVGGLDHPEGIAVLPDGDVLAGGEAGQLYLVHAGEAHVVARTDGFLLGVTADASGTAFLADIGATKRIWRWSPAEGLSEFSRGSIDRPFAHPNAMALSPAGLYVSDSGAWKAGDGCIHLLDASGRGLVASTEMTAFPNGLAVSPDGQWLYCAESNHGITRGRIETGGRIVGRETVLAMPGRVPDGLLFDGAGGLLVTCYQPNAVFRLSPDGRCELLVEDPEAQVLSMPTNGAWAPDGQLLLANLGGWHLATVPVPFPPAAPTAHVLS